MMNLTAPSNALEIEAARAKDICDRLLSFQVKQSGSTWSPDITETVNTLRAIEGLNNWSLVVNCAKQNKHPASLGLAHSSFSRNIEVCQPQIKKHGSVEKFLTHAETLIPVDENTRKPQ